MTQSIEEMLGGKVEAIQHSPSARQALEASVFAECIRTLIKKAMREDKVSVRELARRLNVSPSVVSRRLAAEGDIQAWTAAVMAYQLGREFSVSLHKVHGGEGHRSNSGPHQVVICRQSAATRTSSTPQITMSHMPAIATSEGETRIRALVSAE